jgi:RHS repeat-associated protein
VKHINEMTTMRLTATLLAALAAGVGFAPKFTSAAPRISENSRIAVLASQFEEPLIRTSPTSPEEDGALLSAIAAYRQQKTPDDLSALERFLSRHPRSGWRVALLTNLGLSYYHYGYFSRAIDAFGQAWKEGRSLAERHARALVDRAVGELARMHARLGHADALEALFKDIGDRHVTGPATEAIAGAREGLAVMRTDPGIAYLCGPMALKNLLLSEHFKYEDVAFLDEVRSGEHGVTLSEVSKLADRAKLPHRVVFRTLGQPVPVPSVVHWRVSHFAAIVDKSADEYHVIDPTFGRDLWIGKSAIDAESDGYFLVPTKVHALAWRGATQTEAARVRGMGYPGSVETGDPPGNCCGAQDTPGAGTTPSSPMAVYSFQEMLVSLNIRDTPVGYTPPKGPPVKVTLTYSQREAFQPANFSYFNIGQKWSLNWLSFIQDDPSPGKVGTGVSRNVAGGGNITYSGYNSKSGEFTPETRDASVLSRATSGAISYRRSLADGGAEIYSTANGATTNPRLIFLTQIIDPAGNTVSLSYDNQQRLTSITDATGRLTTFTYGLSSEPLLITQITDPFGRSAQLAYDSSGRLIEITDILGLKSQFSYDASSLINAMTTPYGTTQFTYGGSGTNRVLTATDPMGYTERLEWHQPATGVLAFSDPVALIPRGIINPFNQYLTGRDTFYWDKHAYAVAQGDYTKARIRHWMHLDPQTMYHALESYKYPLENRVWMNHPNQPNTGFSGSLDYPSRTGRVLDDGSTQLTQNTYNTLGHITDTVDAMGRETQIIYGANQIDLLQVNQKTSESGYSQITAFTYNDQHLPLTYTDAAGQTTHYAYNTAGQLTKTTDALGEITSYTYDTLGRLITVTNANNKTQASFTYDAYDRIATATDSEGYTVSYAYDAFDRLTQETFPDKTTRQYAYANLDLVSVTDRQGRLTKYVYDANRNPVSVTDPLQHQTKFASYENGKLKSLTDANGNPTSWTIDIQSRVTGKTYPGGQSETYAYESTTSRLKSETDALGQVKQYSYTQDNQLAALQYQNAVNPTPNVQFTYDPYFQRIVSMIDGTGTTTYAYYPTGALGALQLSSETNSYLFSAINYQYDVIGRMTSRAVDGNAETFAFDDLGRLSSHDSPMGNFTYGYLGQTVQVASRQLGSGAIGTSYDFDTNLNDRRLLAITNSGTARSFHYTTTPEYLITQIAESAPSGTTWPQQTWNYGYDNADRLTSAQSSSGAAYNYGYDAVDNILSIQSPSVNISASYNSDNQVVAFGGQPSIYDANGNLADDGRRTYQFDAENRLVRVASKTTTAPPTWFVYDGRSRRVGIYSGLEGTGFASGQRFPAPRPAGGPAGTAYIWCGEVLCEAKALNGAPLRSYYPEGEFLWGIGTSLYYSQDQIGSVRDVVFKTNTNAAAFDYDPFGNPIQSSGRLGTDFRYGGLFYDQQDGLYLTHYRIYDARTGRWLSRDPLGDSVFYTRHLAGLDQAVDKSLNTPSSWFHPHKVGPEKHSTLINVNTDLYSYAKLQPVSNWDRTGLCTPANDNNDDGCQEWRDGLLGEWFLIKLRESIGYRNELEIYTYNQAVITYRKNCLSLGYPDFQTILW